jgi:hypothetical protein
LTARAANFASSWIVLWGTSHLSVRIRYFVVHSAKQHVSQGAHATLALATPPASQDMGPEHPVVAISLQTLGHVLRLRQQLDDSLEVAKRCEALRSASSSQAQGPQMAAALYLQVCLLFRHVVHQTGKLRSICCTDADCFAGPRCFLPMCVVMSVCACRPTAPSYRCATALILLARLRDVCVWVWLCAGADLL